MPSIRLRPPSPSMAVALLALFVALGGTSYAVSKIGSKQIANNSVRSKDIRNNNVRSKDLRNNDVRSQDVRDEDLTGADVNEGTLGTVPSAVTAGSATTAGNANTLGGIGPGGFVQTPTEATRMVGTPGNPAFENSYKNHSLGASTGFFKDQFGVVHLQGDIDPPGGASTIFTLPEGYRPDQNGAQGPSFLVPGDGGHRTIEVDASGRVSLLQTATEHIAINGITFRATH